MPGLRRHNARPLLRTVGGKPHATEDDHADSLLTPPSTDGKSTTRSIADEDIYRDPDDSEDDTPKLSMPSSVLDDDAIKIVAPTFAMPPQLDGSKEEVKSAASFKRPTSLVADRAEKENADVGDHSSSDTDAMIFDQQPHVKRRKTNGTANLFVLPKRQMDYSRRQTYGGQGGSAKSAKAVKILKTQDNTPSKPEFKIAKGGGMFEFGKVEPLAQFRAPRCSADTDKENEDRPMSRSSSRSSLSDPPSEDEAAIVQELPKPRDYKPPCSICGEPVNVLLKEEFENQYTDGKTMRSYKWQQRFCRWHKEQDAKRARDEKGYPDIDWHGFEKRMRRCHRHLKDVMSGSKSSFYREQLSEKVKERSKTTMQMLNNDGAKRGASVGYYGPRGERVMTEHIINHLSDELREQSTKDRLVAAAGVSGGVSGFVQAVLVPELAEQLVVEDLKVASQRAREVIVDSVELGELLYPDVDDKVAEAVEL